MKKEAKTTLLITTLSFIAFLLWTIAVCIVDVKAIGPEGSLVGFATLNGYFHTLTGTNLTLYNITDWLSVIPLLFVFMFGCIGLHQWIKRKKIKCVDYNILVLGCFYVVVFAVYFFFEIVVVNYRPILIDGCLEASYPSSTTLLVMCVIPTTIMQLKYRMKSRTLGVIIGLFGVFMVSARVISGVHWISDIIGGILLSVFLVGLYSFVIKTTPKNELRG